MNEFYHQRLKQLREDRALKQQELAKILGVRREVVAKWETGLQDIKTDYTLKIAQFFNVSSDYLLGLSDVSTYDTSMISASNCTGLSEKAINAIKSLTEEDKAKINRLFENEKFLKLVTILSDSEVF